MKRISLDNFMQDKSRLVYYRVLNNVVQVITRDSLNKNKHLVRGNSVPRFLIITEPMPEAKL